MRKTSLKLNFIYNTCYQILTIILPLVTSPYLSRVLGSEGIGQYSYTYNIASTFALFGMLGLNNYGSRTIATFQDNRSERSRNFWSIWFLQLFMTLLVTIVYIMYLVFMCNPEYRLISYIQIITVLTSMTDINWYFFGMEKFKLTVTRNFVIKILTVASMFCFVKSDSDVWKYTLIVVVGQFISTLAIWPFLKKDIDWCKPKFSDIISHFKDTAMLFLPVIAVTIYKRMDKVMIGILSTMSQTGFYENTEKIINVPLSVITAMGTVMLPRMSYIFTKDDEETSRSYIKLSMEFVCFLACAMAFGIAAISNIFAPVFFGEEFRDVGSLMQAISVTIIFISWANVIRTEYLIPSHKDRVYVVSCWLGAIINLLINWALIPYYGAMGAVVGTIAAEAIVAFYQTWCVRKNLPIKEYVINSLWYVLAGIIMYLSVYFVGLNISESVGSLVIEILVGAVVYLLICAPYIIKRHKDLLARMLPSHTKRQ